ncbi:MAG: MFS transporter [Candidatus Binatia bacterium]
MTKNTDSVTDLETALPSPSKEKEIDATVNGQTVAPTAARRSWRPLQPLLKLRVFDVLRHREFRLLWLGQACSGMAIWMDQVTRGWLIYELTDSALQLGLVRGVQAIPFLLLSPVAGSAADRYSRKKQVIAAQSASGLVFAATALLIFTGQIQPWHVYVTSVLMAIAQVFQQPARASMVAESVPLESLTNAIGLNSVVFNVARSTGPALAGVLIAGIGTGASYSAQAIFFLLATLWTLQVGSAQPSAGRAGTRASRGESFAQSILEGWKFSWRNEAVRTGLLIVFFASLFIVPFTTLLPVFARDLLGVGATGQGLLLTSMGMGALLSAFTIASVGDRLPRGILMLAGVIVYGIAIVLFAASPWFNLSIALMAVVGLCHVSAHALIQTVIQSYSPAEFRGRTTAIFHMSQVVMTVGSMLFGGLAALWGAPWAVASMGMAGSLATVAIFVALPRARDIR